MKTAVFTNTKNGAHVAEVIAKRLDAVLFSDTPVNLDTVKKCYATLDALILVMSCDSAVRTMAPIVGKRGRDTAVVVANETGDTVVSLLSGQDDDADVLAGIVATIIGGQSVITSEKALQHDRVLPFDLFESPHGFFIENPKEIQPINNYMLAGNDVALLTDYNIGRIPPNIKVVPLSEMADSLSQLELECCILFSPSLRRHHYRYRHRLLIRPKNIVVGASCKKNIAPELFEKVLLSFLHKNEISIHALYALTTVHALKDERALLEFAKKYGIMHGVVPANNLMEYEDNFSIGQFVNETTGIENAAEGCAKYAFPNTKLICKKTIYKGIALAVGEISQTVVLKNNFEPNSQKTVYPQEPFK